jgi:hypothetical protein
LSRLLINKVVPNTVNAKLLKPRLNQFELAGVHNAALEGAKTIGMLSWDPVALDLISFLGAGFPYFLRFHCLVRQSVFFSSLTHLFPSGCVVVNIGAEDLSKAAPTLILGVVWQIIRVCRNYTCLRSDIVGPCF